MKFRHLLTVLCVLLTSASCIDSDEAEDDIINYINPGDRIPEFANSATGRSISSAEFAGKRSLLVLFGSYCPDCNVVLPIVHEVWLRVKDNPDNLVVAISRKEAEADVATYWTSKGYDPMPFYLDPYGDTFYKFANSTIPRIYIVNAEGVVEKMWVERMNVSADELTGMLQP